jgi:hypothetical protein
MLRRFPTPSYWNVVVWFSGSVTVRESQNRATVRVVVTEHQRFSYPDRLGAV